MELAYLLLLLPVGLGALLWYHLHRARKHERYQKEIREMLALPPDKMKEHRLFKLVFGHKIEGK